ncbi:MAG TPA: ion channel [Actinomycetota bacterium]
MTRLTRAFWSASSYGLVLVLIIVSYGLAVEAHSSWAPSLVLAVQIATVWFTLRTSRAHRSIRIAASVLLVWAAAIAIVNVFDAHATTDNGILFLTAGVLYLIAPLSIVRHLVLRHVVDEETLLGALAAYLLFGMCFAFAYQTLAVLQQGQFFGVQGEGTFSQDLFFSFTTLTTTGYGNLVPAKNPGQSLAVTEMLLGQLFLITAVGKIVATWQPRRFRESQGGKG